MAGSPYCKLISWKSLIKVVLNSPSATEGSSSIEHFSPLSGWWVWCAASDNGCQVWQSNHLLGKTLVITSKLFGLRRQLLLCNKMKGCLRKQRFDGCSQSVCLQRFLFAVARCNHAHICVCACVLVYVRPRASSRLRLKYRPEGRTYWHPSGVQRDGLHCRAGRVHADIWTRGFVPPFLKTLYFEAHYCFQEDLHSFHIGDWIRVVQAYASSFTAFTACVYLIHHECVWYCIAIGKI